MPLKLQDGVLDTRGMPKDKHRGLPVPDAMHQLKSALIHYEGKEISVIVEREQEVQNMEKIAKYRGYKFSSEKRDGFYQMDLKVK